jgi:hypothetical protein
MTPERAAALVVRWVRFYTRDLPPDIAERRAIELHADVHDHIAHERARRVREKRIARSVALRMIRGIRDDVAWRADQPSSKAAAERTRPTEDPMRRSNPLSRPPVRIALGVLALLAIPLVATIFGDGEGWGPFDFVLGAAVLTMIGIVLELAIRRRGTPALAVGVAALGVVAAVLGELDDAPGLVGMGVLMIAGACAMGIRSAHAR